MLRREIHRQPHQDRRHDRDDFQSVTVTVGDASATCEYGLLVARLIIADNLSKSGWSWGCVSSIDSNGRTRDVPESLARVCTHCRCLGGDLVRRGHD